MKFNLSILGILLSAFLNATGQTTENIKQLQQKILSADSIVLISHVLTVEFAPKLVEDWDKTKKRPLVKKHAPYPKYLKNEKVNPAIIKQRKAISKSEMNELSEIFRVEKAIEINQTKCDMPHHSIIIFKNSDQSFIDICFYCKSMHTSKGINLEEAEFTDNKWEKLKAFFKRHGLTYKLKEPVY